MKKKILALCLCIALAATAIVGASLAYFTDTDEATNTFTSGNVKIDLIEQEYKGDQLVDFSEKREDHVLLPYTGKNGNKDHSTNYQDKIVNVKNTGSQPAYVRVKVAVPCELDKILHIDWNSGDWTMSTVVENRLVNGVSCDIYTITYNEAVAADATTLGLAMRGLYLDPMVDFDNDINAYTFKGNKINLDLTKLDIPVIAQAVQSQGFANSTEAFNAANIAYPDTWKLDFA